jgi:prepilin-type processing-associated H-X9-DG protein
LARGRTIALAEGNRVKASQFALTRVEALVLLGIFALIGLWWWLVSEIDLGRSREEARKANCKENLSQIGKAMAAYREDNGDYFPFSWQRAGEAEPVGDGAGNAAMTAPSLGDLYPRFVTSPRLFRCPSTEDQPSFVLNLPLEYRSPNPLAFYAPPEGINWTLTSNLPISISTEAVRASSYGYDPRISPRSPAGHVAAADWDGSWQANHDTSDQNHEGGQNVLFVDGHATWKTTDFCSNDPNDNVYSENAWDADTDSYLVDMDAGLGVSFDGYKHLHYPQKPKP